MYVASVLLYCSPAEWKESGVIEPWWWWWWCHDVVLPHLALKMPICTSEFGGGGCYTELGGEKWCTQIKHRFEGRGEAKRSVLDPLVDTVPNTILVLGEGGAIEF